MASSESTCIVCGSESGSSVEEDAIASPGAWGSDVVIDVDAVVVIYEPMYVEPSRMTTWTTMVNGQIQRQGSRGMMARRGDECGGEERGGTPAIVRDNDRKIVMGR